MKNTLRDLFVIFVSVVSVSSLLLAEDSNITNTTTTTSAVTSNNTNTNNNTNANTNVNQSTSTSSNTNYNTNNNTTAITQTTNSTAANTNNNTSVVTSTVNQTQNVNNTSLITNNSTSSNSNTNVNNSTSSNSNLNSNTNVNTSSSDVTTNNQNSNTNVNSSTNNNNNTNVSRNDSTQKVTQRVKSPPPSAVAPSIMSYSQDLCTTGASSAVQTQFFGVSSGRSVRDENCERLKNSKALYDMGMKVAAVALLCENKGIFRAMIQAGSPCPYKGKIGEEARIAWEENPQDRPDWKDIKKEYASHDFKAYKKEDFCKKFPKHKICIG